MKNCPCDSKKEYSKCCEPLIDHSEEALTPEQLMRARYTAFTIKDMDYVYETTHPQARFEFDRKANQEWADQAHFTQLEVMNTSIEANKGLVEFKAHFKIKDSEPAIHHEVASFRKQQGVWYFRDAKIVKPISK